MEGKKMAKKVVLAGACRTAIGTMGGGLSTTPAAELGAIVIKEALNSGTVPAGANTKQFEKLLKKCSHIVGAKVVNLYTIRDCGFEDSTYRVFAFPVKATLLMILL